MSEFKNKDFAEKCDCDKHHEEHLCCIKVCVKKREFCEPSMKICDCSPKCRPPHCNPCKCCCECKCKPNYEHDCRCGYN